MLDLKFRLKDLVVLQVFVNLCPPKQQKYLKNMSCDQSFDHPEPDIGIKVLPDCQ